MFGLLLLDKPLGLSSNRALQRAKRLFAAAKAGHAGSLDPLATGMLPIFFGAATRLAAFMLEARKTYRVVATLGSATTTGDAEGETIEDRGSRALRRRQRIAAAAGRFVGEIDASTADVLGAQARRRAAVPARAFRHRGRARPRRVRHRGARRSSATPGRSSHLRVRCSKGTYVRTLVEDVARAAGTVGHVAALRRLAVSPFAEQDMRTFEELEAAAAEGAAPRWPVAAGRGRARRLVVGPGAAERRGCGSRTGRPWPPIPRCRAVTSRSTRNLGGSSPLAS